MKWANVRHISVGSGVPAQKRTCAEESSVLACLLATGNILRSVAIHPHPGFLLMAVLVRFSTADEPARVDLWIWPPLHVRSFPYASIIKPPAVALAVKLSMANISNLHPATHSVPHDLLDLQHRQGALCRMWLCSFLAIIIHYLRLIPMSVYQEQDVVGDSCCRAR